MAGIGTVLPLSLGSAVSVMDEALIFPLFLLGSPRPLLAVWLPWSKKCRFCDCALLMQGHVLGGPGGWDGTSTLCARFSEEYDNCCRQLAAYGVNVDLDLRASATFTRLQLGSEMVVGVGCNRVCLIRASAMAAVLQTVCGDPDSLAEHRAYLAEFALLADAVQAAMRRWRLPDGFSVASRPFVLVERPGRARFAFGDMPWHDVCSMRQWL